MTLSLLNYCRTLADADYVPGSGYAAVYSLIYIPNHTLNLNASTVTVLL